MARSNPKLDAIYDVFDKHGVELNKDSIWSVQGTPVVKHKDVERLGAKLNIKYDIPTLIRSERDEAVIMVVGRIGERMEWSIGEALIVKDKEPGGNYRVTGKQASYVYAMAEKRAKDRVILKLADLHGDVYSEDEADDFSDRSKRDDAPPRGGSKSASNDNKSNDQPKDDRSIDEVFDGLKAAVDDSKTVKDVTDYMNHEDTVHELTKVLSKDDAAEIRKHAMKKMEELGWKKGDDTRSAKG